MSIRRIGSRRGIRAQTLGADYASQIMADSPKAFLRLREASGSTFVDASGQGHDATLHSSGIVYGEAGPIVSDGAASKAIKLTGGTFLDIPTGAWLDVQAFTQNIWFKQTALHNNAGVMTRFQNAGGGASLGSLWIDTNSVINQNFPLAGTTRSAVSIGQPIAKIWHMLTTTVNSANGIKVYVNGVLNNTDTNTGTVGTGNSALAFGSYSNGSALLTNAWLAEPAWFDQEVSAARIAAWYAAAFAA